jgi:hypothetical protein
VFNLFFSFKNHKFGLFNFPLVVNFFIELALVSQKVTNQLKFVIFHGLFLKRVLGQKLCFHVLKLNLRHHTAQGTGLHSLKNDFEASFNILRVLTGVNFYKLLAVVILGKSGVLFLSWNLRFDKLMFLLASYVLVKLLLLFISHERVFLGGFFLDFLFNG